MSCCLCFSPIGGFKAAWANNICFLRKRNGQWIVDRHDLLIFRRNFISYEDAPYPIHISCWDILEACWDYMETFPFDFAAMADIFVAQTRKGNQLAYSRIRPCWFPLPNIKDTVSIVHGLCVGDEHGSPDDFSYLFREGGRQRCVFPQASRRVVTSKRQMGSTRPSLTPAAINRLLPELCLQVLCLLPTVSVKAARLACRGMADVPLAGIYWKSRFSRPDLSHIPLSKLRSLSEAQAEGDVDLKRILSECRSQNSSRDLIITYNESLIEMMRQRRKVLGLPTCPRLPEDVVCHRFLSVLKNPVDSWQPSNKLNEWRSLVIFDRETPISSCCEITLTFVPRHGKHYLSGIEFHFPQHKLALGHTEANTEWAVEHQKFQHNGVLGTKSSAYGFLAVRAAEKVDFDVVLEAGRFNGADDDFNRSWKSSLFPAESSQICGFQAELSVDNRITSLGLLEPKSAPRTAADRIFDKFYQREYKKDGLDWSD